MTSRRSEPTAIFDMMAKFAAYGFNKSHSAAYGWIAYQTAYLKAHYRPEFMAALMTIEVGKHRQGVCPTWWTVERLGVAVLPVLRERSRTWHFDRSEAGWSDEVDDAKAMPHSGREVRARCGEERRRTGAIEAIVEARGKAPGAAFRQRLRRCSRGSTTQRVNRQGSWRVSSRQVRSTSAGIPRAALIAGAGRQR